MEPILETPPQVMRTGPTATRQVFEVELHSGFRFVEARLSKDETTLETYWLDDDGTADGDRVGPRGTLAEPGPRRTKKVRLVSCKPTRPPDPDMSARLLGEWKNADHETVLLYQLG